MVRSERSLDAEPPRHTMEQRRETIDSVREWRGRQRQVGNGPAVIEPQSGATDSVREWRSRERRVGNSPADVEQHNGTLGADHFGS